MKIKLIILTTFIILATSTYASKARLEALGQSSSTGSYYISDSRNIFSNPASVNFFKNYIISEWGVSNDDLDSTLTPHTEGGFFKEEGSFIYGIYLGNEIGTRNDARQTATTGDPKFLMHDNPFDFFFGGDAGVLWGIRAHYAGSNDQSGTFEKKHKAYSIGFGAILNNLEYYGNVDIDDSSEGATALSDKWESDLGFTTGISYIFEGVNLFAEYSKNGYTYQATGTKVNENGEIYLIGFGKIYDITQTSKLFFDIHYKRTDEKFTGSKISKSKKVTVPITFSFEAKTYDWLILRGSISQNIHSDDAKHTIANSAVTTAGATLIFKQVELDGLIGTTTSTTNRDPANSSEGILATDNLMTRVSLKYNF
jgi:hypothetical protein